MFVVFGSQVDALKTQSSSTSSCLLLAIVDIHENNQVQSVPVIIYFKDQVQKKDSYEHVKMHVRSQMEFIRFVIERYCL